MKTTWVLPTNGDPLGVVRHFLGQVWSAAGLDGMLLPQYQVGVSLAPVLITSPQALSQTDPLAPLVAVNAAGLAPVIGGLHPEARLGVVLRSCEARAFRWLVQQGYASPDQWLVIGVDCLASFPQVDFEWRVQKAGTVESLTRESLRFARNGGVAPYRYRRACQMCASPAAQAFGDLNIELIGLPVKQALLVTARDEDISNALRLGELTVGKAPAMLVERRQRVLSGLCERRERALQHNTLVLSPDAPVDLEGLFRHISGCALAAGCDRACLQACPIYTEDFMAEPARAASEWLQGCTACGMCEEACPRHLPLTAIISRINRRVYAAGVVA